MQIIIAIDPGKNGGIVVRNGKNILMQKMPETPKEIFDFFSKWSKVDSVCVMEKVGGMPKMGGSSMFNFGKGYGHLEMALIACQIKTITVTPQKWQKHYQLGTKSQCASPTIWKNKLKAKAEQLFPKEKIHLWSADAILICEYARANNLS